MLRSLVDACYLVMDAEKVGTPLNGVTKIKTIYEPWSNKKPLDGQVCQINYILSLSDGTMVESSRERRKNVPFSFVLGSTDIVEGISMAVRTFGQGERSIVKIASELGYGYDGIPPLIPPNAELICDIELVDFSERQKLFDKPLMCTL
eukprot:CCRYP_000418-RA/>CCRYP_000418-RA protein AED:0.14 eAED:0.14 QI:6092/1/1/1/0.8/0.5/6/314/147